MLNFSKSVFRGNANFNNLTIWAKDSYFSEIQAEKNFSMIYSSFFGNLYMQNAKFSDKFSMQETSVKGKLSLNNSQFQAKAGFDLISVDNNAFFNYATFEKGADFSLARFMCATEFVNTKFNGMGIFEKAFFLNSVNLEGIDIDKDLILKGTFFETQIQK
jgi:hypothetical protein